MRLVKHLRRAVTPTTARRLVPTPEPAGYASRSPRASAVLDGGRARGPPRCAMPRAAPTTTAPPASKPSALPLMRRPGKLRATDTEERPRGWAPRRTFVSVTRSVIGAPGGHRPHRRPRARRQSASPPARARPRRVRDRPLRPGSAPSSSVRPSPLATTSTARGRTNASSSARTRAMGTSADTYRGSVRPKKLARREELLRRDARDPALNPRGDLDLVSGACGLLANDRAPSSAAAWGSKRNISPAPSAMPYVRSRVCDAREPLAISCNACTGDGSGMRHRLRLHELVELARRSRGRGRRAASLSVMFLRVRRLRDLRARSRSRRPASAVTSMSELATCRAMTSRFGSMPTTQCSRKLSHASARSSTLSSTSCTIIGLNTLSSQMPPRAGDADGDVVAHHVRAHHRERLGLRRVHLARHDRAAGLVRRDEDLAEAGARTAREEAHVVPDLHARRRAAGEACRSWRPARRGPRAPRTCSARVRNGMPRELRDLRRRRASAHSGCEFRPVPTAVPPSARS